MPTSVPSIPTLDVGERSSRYSACGTWQLRGEQCAEIVAAALRLGYRHIDTAQGYDNEEAVGEGIRRLRRRRASGSSSPPRCARSCMADGDLQRSVEESLRKLGCREVDLLLLHWPNPAIPLADSIRALNGVKRDGLARHIGVSNFTMRASGRGLASDPEPIAAEQIEYHPYLDQTQDARGPARATAWRSSPTARSPSARSSAIR